MAGYSTRDVIYGLLYSTYLIVAYCNYFCREFGYWETDVHRKWHIEGL
jgi:hypothetical protein